jgi:hypothetical protein
MSRLGVVEPLKSELELCRTTSGTACSTDRASKLLAEHDAMERSALKEIGALQLYSSSQRIRKLSLLIL